MWLLLTACLINDTLYAERRAELLDQDSDGHISAEYPEEGGDDCDDHDANVHPGQDEIPYDGVDNDCDEGTPDDDLDGDGHGIETDCDDGDDAINPDATEICDGIDNDCDGVDSCLPQGTIDVVDAPLSLRLDVDEDTVTGANLSFLDFDGDGLDDVLIASPLAGDMAGRIDLVNGLGGLDPGGHDIDQVATLTVLGDGGPGLLGGNLAQACDVDGDGFDDIVTSANGDGDGVVYAFAGGPLGASGTIDLTGAEWSLWSEGAGGYFGTGLACGRLNDDVAADFVVGEYQSAGGNTWLFGGNGGDEPPARSTADADLVIELGSVGGAWLGRSALPLGDLDGDGTRELAVAAPWCDAGPGCVWIESDAGRFIGTGTTESLTTDDLDALIRASDHIGFGTTIRHAGDIDGDGLADLLISSRDDDYGAYGAWLFTAFSTPDTWSRTTDDAVARWDLVYAGDQLSAECDAGSDVDGDGHADILIGEQGADLGAAMGGAALLYLGGPDLQGSYTDADAFASLISTTAGGRAGAAVAMAPDANGDGFADIAVGVPALGQPGGGVAVWWGGPRIGD